MEPQLPHHNGWLSRTAGGCFLLLSAGWALLFSREALFFVIDPIPGWVNFVLLFGWLAVFILLLVPTGWLWTFAFDRKARRVIAVSFLFWVIVETLHAASFGSTHFFLHEGGSFPPIIWQPWELALVFPFLGILEEDAYFLALMLEGALMKNSLLMRFVLYCIYWPAVIALEGTAFFTLIFYMLRGIVRFCRFLKRHTAETISDNPELISTVSISTVPASAVPAKKGGKRTRFYAVFAVLLLAALAGWWGYFIAVNRHQCQVWNQDFQSARTLLTRFAAENFRHPHQWDEITEGSRVYQPGGVNRLERGEYYYKNPGLKDRIELNFSHLKLVDAGEAYPSEEWIFRIAPASPKNPTGETEPFEWPMWQGMMANLLAVDLMGFGPPKSRLPEREEKSASAADPAP